jgi:(2R)-3-sulfolactate dehydrogenase (NADP+)
MFNHDFDSAPQEIAHFVIAIDASKLSVDGENNRLADFAGEVNVAGGRLPGSNRVNPGKLNLDEEITITDSVAAQLGL